MGAGKPWAICRNQFEKIFLLLEWRAQAERQPRAPGFPQLSFSGWSVLAVWGTLRAVRQKMPAAWLFVGLLLTYPTTYYFVFPHARYRHPIEPELVILAAFLLSQLDKKPKAQPTGMSGL